MGIGGQAATDFSRGRPGSAGDYLGAGIGGLTAALMIRNGRARYVGAANGSVTSLAQDALNDRALSIDRARKAAAVGAVVGSGSGLAGRIYSNSMKRAAKERLGENASLLRTWARGDKTLTTKKTREYLPNRKYTYPDQRTSRELVESKFGIAARLSRRQLEASQMLENYRVDHLLPEDIGLAISLLSSTLGIPIYKRGVNPTP